MTDYKCISERNRYQSIICELRKRLSVYEPPPRILIDKYHYHCFVVTRKGKEFKIKVLKWTPHYQVGHVNSYGWEVIMILKQQSLFTFEYVYKKD